MRITTGDVHLTIVNGGLSSPSIEPTAPELPFLERMCAEHEVPAWDAKPLVARLVGFARRDLDEQEIDDLLFAYSWARRRLRHFGRMIAGDGIVVPMDDSGEFFRVVRDDMDDDPTWAPEVRAEYDGRRERRSA